MKKMKIMIGLLLLLFSWVLIFLIDFSEVLQNRTPVFCVAQKFYEDGGSIEYWCLGYKVIKYNKLNGYKKSHIGFYTMKYDETLTSEERNTQERYHEKLEETPLAFTIQDAITKDYYIVTSDIAYNEYILEEFQNHINEKREDEIRFVKETPEGNLILGSLKYNMTNFIIQIDERRDNKTITTQNYDATDYMFEIKEENLILKNSQEEIELTPYKPSKKNTASFQIQYKNDSEETTLKQNDVTIFIYGKVWINVEQQSYTLQEALQNKKITIKEILDQAKKDVDEKKIIKISTEKETTYIYEDYAIITKNNEKEIYFGLPNLIVK